MKFDSLYTEALDKLDEAPAIPPPDATASMTPPAAPQVPSAPPVPQKVTPEGKRFMIEMLLKALAFDPSSITDQDKSIFDETVTPENADTILSRIEQIMSGTGVDRGTEIADADDGI